LLFIINKLTNKSLLVQSDLALSNRKSFLPAHPRNTCGEWVSGSVLVFCDDNKHWNYRLKYNEDETYVHAGTSLTQHKRTSPPLTSLV